MKLFLDTADTQEWHPIPGCAPIAGVTTNPSLVVQAGLTVSLPHYCALIARARAQRMNELMLQLPSPVERDCLDWAAVLSAESAGVNLTFKLPCHKDWQHAHTGLRAAGYATLLTGVSNSAQLLWAQAQDAVYVAPYLGRLEAAGRDVMGFIAALVAVQHQGGPKVMAASVKTEFLLNALLAQGVYACTVKPGFLNDLVCDGVTQSAMEQFAKDCTLNDDTPR